MVKNHLKRLAAPRSWPLHRKERKYVTRPTPNRSFTLAIPLSHVMKILLTKAATTKEVRYILHNKNVLLNGKRVYDHRRAVGFMDVLSFPDIDEHYLISLSPKGKLSAVKLDKKNADSRFVKIKNKSRLSGKIQVNCTDGTNILIAKNDYATGDTLVLKAGKIAKHLPLKEGCVVTLTGGSHLAKVGTVSSLDGETIVITNDEGSYETASRYAFVIGDKTAEVNTL